VLASDFDFELPQELIAQHPVEPRDQCRLMVIDRQAGRWRHCVFADLPHLLESGDLLVRNNSRVVPARLIGIRSATGGKWEGLFLREHSPETWEILATTRGRPVIGEKVVIGQGLTLLLEGRGNGGSWIVRPQRQSAQPEPTYELLEQYGQTPLPPYIRNGRESAGDRQAYQTLYARNPGSVAAPTAGLHFTDELFGQLRDRGIDWVDLTLHVGVGTFRPIEAERIEDHVMHAEWAELSPQIAESLNAQRKAGKRIVAVGTTAARTLETAAQGRYFTPFTGETQLFIRPGHIFQGVDALITNFHLPRSSLLVLVSTLAGVDLIRAAYADAIQNRYRFFSFGDAMLIL
jgi:S-adenosylmethionine:tRNA ribosyltransferase-isomerase